MKTTAMLYGPGGAQRVTVLPGDHYDIHGEPATKIETRDGDIGLVKTSLLQNFREEDNE